MIRPAGDTTAGGSIVPAGAAGTDDNGFYVDSNCNVLRADGSVAGAAGSSPADGQRSPDPPGTNVGGVGVFNCGTGFIGTPGTTSGTGPGKSMAPTGVRAPVPTTAPRPSTGISRNTMIIGGVAVALAVGAAVYFSSRG